MLELLAPAGSMEALKAAVQNGANAVYLGCGEFNARQSAKNFTPQTLTEAIKYCHVRGVQVHLTVNPLVSDRETQDLSALIAHAARSGIDAFIVQDLGVIQLCKQIAPHVPIHGSTQMTVHSLPGVQLCAGMGITRVPILPLRLRCLPMVLCACATPANATFPPPSAVGPATGADVPSPAARAMVITVMKTSPS